MTCTSPVTNAQPDPDAELKRQWVICNSDLPDMDEDTAGKIWSDAIVAVDTLPAHTLAGLSVKVQALATSAVDGDTITMADLLRTTREALDQMIPGTVTHWPTIRSVLPPIEGKAQMGQSSSPQAGAATVATTAPDSDLLALALEWSELTTLGDLKGMADEMWDHRENIEDQIAATPARTLPGVAAKMRLVWHWQGLTNAEAFNGPQPDSSPRTKAVWGILQDINRLIAGGGQ